MPMGAHVTSPARKQVVLCLLVVFSLVSTFMVTTSMEMSEIDSLLKFKDGLANTGALNNWNASISPCDFDYANWNGVMCMNGTVIGLKLVNMDLKGLIDVDSLLSLPSLRIVNLMNNNFEGSLPNLKKLGSVKSLYLSNNRFSGDIPDNAFSGLGSLKKLYMENNDFTGEIPTSITSLPKLMELNIQGNQFRGKIPEFRQKTLRYVNLANNKLEGQIPESLNEMDSTSFAGNKGLCGKPLESCSASPSPSPAPSKESEKSTSKKTMSFLSISIILLVVAIILGILAALFIIFYWKKHKSREPASFYEPNPVPLSSYGNNHQQEKVALEAVGGSHNKKADHRLSFVRDDMQRFDLQDLLRASAEVLGSGTFGASYKADVSSGQAVVVKRYKQMNQCGREFFHEHMRRLGRLQHPNLLPLTAYYYRKEEKLLVTEFVDNGSLASKLHVKQSAGEPGLDWQTRLKIIKGVVKGLAYLYSELPSLVLPHGHLKSSNVLIDKNFEALLTDYALRPVINSDHAHTLMVSYKSPEYAQNGRITKKSDIWSLGIVILELLTGKFPENYLTQGYDRNMSLSVWVNNMVKEKRTSEVFDKEMKGSKDSKLEMINLLKIGLSCCEEDVETRLDLKGVVEKIEELKEGEYEEDHHFNEGYAYSFKGTEEDEFSMIG